MTYFSLQIDFPGITEDGVAYEIPMPHKFTGGLTIGLPQDKIASPQAYPTEWIKGPTGYKPSLPQAGSVAHIIYNTQDLPTQLIRAPYQLTFTAPEILWRGTYAQVITDPQGNKVETVQRTIVDDPQEADHACILRLAGSSLIALWLSMTKIGPVMSIDKFEVIEPNIWATYVVVKVTRLALSPFNPDAPNKTPLPPNLAFLQPAINALVALWHCQQSDCQGHYFTE